MTARDPSQAELLSKFAAQAARTRRMSLPGIVQSYDPVLNTVEAMPAVIAEDETSESSPITAPFRVPNYGGFMNAWQPVPGDQCTLIFHGLDASSFFAAPTGAARAALVQDDGVSCEAWPGTYLPLPALPPPGTAWFGSSAMTAGVGVTGAGVAIGTLAADAPLVRGTELAAWLTAWAVYSAALIAWIATAGPSGSPPVPPVPSPTLLSALAKVT